MAGMQIERGREEREGREGRRTHPEGKQADHTITTWQIVVCEGVFSQFN